MYASQHVDRLVLDFSNFPQIGKLPPKPNPLIPSKRRCKKLRKFLAWRGDLYLFLENAQIDQNRLKVFTKFL
uniref:Uncharacterized protein n=1 Tax=Megaselia scalaris TaxID=36166 RepID=T1GUG4_MEGSC